MNKLFSDVKWKNLFWHILFLTLNTWSRSCLISLWNNMLTFSSQTLWSIFTTPPLFFVSDLLPDSSIDMLVIRGKILSQTLKKSITDSSVPLCVTKTTTTRGLCVCLTLVIHPLHAGGAFTPLIWEFFKKKFSSLFPFWFCGFGSFVISLSPAHRLPSVCITIAALTIEP